jgi:hypothetical protein
LDFHAAEVFEKYLAPIFWVEAKAFLPNAHLNVGVVGMRRFLIEDVKGILLSAVLPVSHDLCSPM